VPSFSDTVVEHIIWCYNTSSLFLPHGHSSGYPAGQIRQSSELPSFSLVEG